MINLARGAPSPTRRTRTPPERRGEADALTRTLSFREGYGLRYGKVRSVGPRRSAGSAAQHALSRTARGKFVRLTLNNPLPSPFS